MNSTFHASYAKYAHNGEDYLESGDFRLMYSRISLLQAQLDRTYLYGMLVSSNKKDEKKSYSNMKPTRMKLWHGLSSLGIMTIMNQKRSG